MASEPWQRYEVPGPIKAVVIKKPEIVSTLLNNAKNPILIVGHEVAEIDLGGKKPIDHIIRIARASNIPVVTTANTLAEFLKRDFKPAASMTSMDIGNRLTDPEWSVSGENGPHDLALILGMTYYVGFVIEAGLKSFAFHHLKTVSLDRYYQPHCNWSFPNLSIRDWDRNLTIIAQEIEKK
ncbi:MAG: CO dehydrogenase/acetyl-CoA synthase complex subunit epsilon [Methanocellales archaeon]|nr:CO dehydrogenase/acetyl-CoA synthase complex subunit epsilon [Methanocellales archaeon]